MKERALQGPFDYHIVAKVASNLLQAEAGEISIELRPLRNGLESSVGRVVARLRLDDGRTRTRAFVVKHTADRGHLEANIYAHLAGLTSIGAPRLLGARSRTPGLRPARAKASSDNPQRGVPNSS